jgi:hypothetical protein
MTADHTSSKPLLRHKLTIVNIRDAAMRTSTAWLALSKSERQQSVRAGRSHRDGKGDEAESAERFILSLCDSDRPGLPA